MVRRILNLEVTHRFQFFLVSSKIGCALTPIRVTSGQKYFVWSTPPMSWSTHPSFAKIRDFAIFAFVCLVQRQPVKRLAFEILEQYCSLSLLHTYSQSKTLWPKLEIQHALCTVMHQVLHFAQCSRHFCAGEIFCLQDSLQGL